MPAPSWPRLSDAKTLLPHLRAHLAGAAPRYSLPVNIAIDLLPIAEDGLFGYELVPDRNTHTYLTIGCCETGEALLRSTMGADAPSALRLAAVDGKAVSRRNLDPDIRLNSATSALPKLLMPLKQDCRSSLRNSRKGRDSPSSFKSTYTGTWMKPWRLPMHICPTGIP